MSRAEQRRHGAPTSPDQIRNVVLVGPSGSGKTTLFERLAAVDATGRTTEPEPSTAVRVAAVEHGEVTINLVDTPGQPDFVGEVRAGLRAADAALFVVSAGDGVDDATRLLWRECDAVGMPRAVAVTKLEAARADYDVVVDDCQRIFGDAVALYFPLRDGERLTGVADVLARTVRDLADASADDHAESAEPRPPTGAEGDLIDERRSEVIESVIEESEDEGLLERYLSGDDIRVEEVVDDVRLAIGTARFFPLVPTHAPVGLGTAELLRLFVRGFPAPDSAPLPTASTPEGGSFGTLACDPDGPLVAEVVRTSTDPYVGKLSLVRVFSGTLRGDDRVHVSGHLEHAVGHPIEGHPDHDDDERVGQLSTPVLDGTAPRSHAVAGDIVLVTKLSRAETSDTVSGTDKPALIEPWVLPEPRLPVAIHAASPGDEDRLASALQRLVTEDVTMRLERNAETHQVVLWALGPAHVDDLLARLRDPHHVEVEVEEVRTSLRETFVKRTAVQGRLVKQSGGHGQYAVVQLEIEPLPRGGGVEFVDKVVGGAVPRQFIPSVEKGARAQLDKGVLAGYPVVDVRITLVDGKAHSVDSSDMAFQTAAAMALRDAANESTVSLLEPVDSIAVTVADDAVGSVLADLRGRRAQVHGTQPAEVAGYTMINAEVPQHELSRYPIDLRSVSHGTGTFTREFARYDYMPSSLSRTVTSAS